MHSLMSRLVAVLLLGLATAAAAHEAPQKPQPLVSETLTISGAVTQPLVLSVADLERLPPQQVDEVSLVCQSGADMGKQAGLRGVLLRDVLSQTAFQVASPRELRRMAVIAKATDDYKVVFSWAELFNSPLGAGVVVYYSKNGEPLGDDEGRIALISTQDTLTGPRHVKWLNEVEVRKVAD